MKWWLPLLALGCLAEEVNEIRLDVEPTGFSCVEEQADGTKDLLVARAFEEPTTTGELNIVLDYLSFEGLPSCNVTLILRACEEDGCPLVHRDCITISVDDVLARVREGPLSADSAFQAFLEELAENPPATQDAPDGVVSIRLAATTQSCESVLVEPWPRFRCEQILGCAYTCPGQLDQVRGEAQVFFDSLALECGPLEVRRCGSIGLDGVVGTDLDTWCL